MDSLEILERYVERVSSLGSLFWLGPLVGAFFLALFATLVTRLAPRAQRLFGYVLVALCCTVGLKLAIDRASIYDDAFISFRYARNWVEGNGLVFNEGERVEGYTNFLWTVGLGAVMWLTPWDAPEIALVLCLLCFVVNVILCYQLSWTLRRDRPATRHFLPLAPMLLAVQGVFTDYATTGMETGLACLFVQLGALVLLRASSPLHFFCSGLALILATLTRPDHALFYAVGSLVVAWTFGRPMWSARGPDRGRAFRLSVPFLVAWAAPFLLYLVVALFKYQYYGSFVPNTYYTKSADQSYFSQGALYAESFYLGTHFWLVGLLFLASLFLRKTSTAVERFRWFAGIAWLVHNVYVMKVGGDFMYGRFYVTLMPFMLLGAELFVARSVAASGGLSRSLKRPLAYLMGGCLATTAVGVRLLEPVIVEWNMTDESTCYRLETFFPVTIDHSNFRIGQELYALHEAGLSPLVATSGIGMFGYESALPILDRMGLVDPVTARQQIEERGRPGHEKRATDSYVRERNPHLIRGGHYTPENYWDLTRIRFSSARNRHDWHIYHYDARLMKHVRKLLDDVRFTRFERHLDQYLRKARKKRPKNFKRDYRFFHHYYFDHNQDPKRERALETLFERYEKPKE